MLPILLAENVNDEVHVVEQDPLSFSFALAPERLHPVALLQKAFDLLGNGLHLTVAVAAADHEEVRDNEKV